AAGRGRAAAHGVLQAGVGRARADVQRALQDAAQRAAALGLGRLDVADRPRRGRRAAGAAAARGRAEGGLGAVDALVDVVGHRPGVVADGAERLAAADVLADADGAAAEVREEIGAAGVAVEVDRPAERAARAHVGAARRRLAGEARDDA